MNASEYWGGFETQVGGATLRLVPGRRLIRLDADGGTVILVLPDSRDLAPGAEHWRIFVKNGSLSFGEVTFQAAGIPVVFGPGLTIVIPPLNPAGDWPLVDNTTGTDTFIPSQIRGTISPFVVVDGAEQDVLFQEADILEEGEAVGGEWLSVSYAGLSGSAPRWVYQLGDWSDVVAKDDTLGLVVSHGLDATLMPVATAARLDVALAVWRTLPAANNARTSAGAFALSTFGQDTHFICGGVGLSSCEKYLLDSWGFVPSLPGAVSFGASWDSISLGFLHGGAESQTALREFLPSSGLGAWVTRTSSPVGRRNHTGGRLGSSPSPFAYISGSGFGQDGSVVQRYQAGLDSWSSAVPRRPSGTTWGATSSGYTSDNGAFARLFFGGRYEWQGQAAPEASRQVWELTASPVDSWRALPQPPSSIVDAAAAGAGGSSQVYVSGGGLFSPSAATLSYRTLDVWRSEPASPFARTGLKAHGTAGRSQA